MFKTIASLSLAYSFPPQFPKPYCSSGLRRLLAFVIKNWPIANTMIMSMKLSLFSFSLGFSLFASLSLSLSKSKSEPRTILGDMRLNHLKFIAYKTVRTSLTFFFSINSCLENSLLVNQQKLQVNETKKKTQTILSTYL